MMYEFDSRVRYSEVDAKGRLTWLALMDYFQDCSVFHSESLQVGVDYLAKNHIAWVLSSWQICVNHMPRLADVVTTQTWAYGMKSFYGYRNFAMKHSDLNRSFPWNAVNAKSVFRKKLSLVLRWWFHSILLIQTSI